MNLITKRELDNQELVSKFSIKDGDLILSQESEYKSVFEIGDIVAYKNNTKKIGVISFIEEEDITVNWIGNTETTENSCDLIVVPPTIGLELIKNSDILDLWENLSNGKNESFDLKCLYFGDIIVNEVPFIRAYKNTDTLVDKKFKRNFSLYRKFGNSQIYRTNIYTICNDNIQLDSSKFAYYLLQDHIVYYLGINLNPDDLSVFLFNK